MEKTKEQLERYFREYYSLVYRVAFAQLKNHADSEDLTQEIFVKILTYDKEFDSHEHEKAWIIRVTINLCRDYFKSKWQQSRVDLDSVAESEKEYYQNPYTAEDNTLWKVLELPENYKNCLYLFYYENYSIKEIGEALDMRENTVKTNLRRGRQELKKRLQKD